MKKAVTYVLILSLSVMKIYSQTTEDRDNSLIDNYIKSKVAFEKERVESDTVAKVFNGTFYKVSAGYSFEFGGALCTGTIIVLNGGKLVAFDNRLDTLFTLLSFVRKDFFLKTENDAKVFETCLDKIFPMSWSDEDAKEHLKIGNKMYFIRGKFFDSKSGYIVTLDGNSKITNISYSMEAIKKE